MKMIIKQPSVCAVALITLCSCIADKVAEGPVTWNADLSRMDSGNLRLGVMPQADPISLTPENPDGKGPLAIELPAPARKVHQPGSSIVINSMHEINRKIS